MAGLSVAASLPPATTPVSEREAKSNQTARVENPNSYEVGLQGREGTRGRAEAAATPALPPPSDWETPAAAGGCRAGRAKPRSRGAGAAGSARCSRLARSGRRPGSQPPVPPPPPPPLLPRPRSRASASSCSCREWKDLEEGRRGGGRGGEERKPLGVCPGEGGGGEEGVRRAFHLRSPPPARAGDASPLGSRGAEGRGAETPRGTEINKLGARAAGQLLPPLRASWSRPRPPPSFQPWEGIGAL